MNEVVERKRTYNSDGNLKLKFSFTTSKAIEANHEGSYMTWEPYQLLKLKI